VTPRADREPAGAVIVDVVLWLLLIAAAEFVA
jgi:hypothetical protein